MSVSSNSARWFSLKATLEDGATGCVDLDLPEDVVSSLFESEVDASDTGEE